MLSSMIKTLITGMALLLLPAFPAFAAGGSSVDTSPVRIVVDSDYIIGKVNDPVSRKTKTAFIVCDNAQFHLEASIEGLSEADVIFYINEYVDGQDLGVRNRVLMKSLPMRETAQMLPDDVFERDTEDGSAFDFVNRCYDVRVFLTADHSQYEDFYFGLVDDNIYNNMYEALLEKELQEEETPDEYTLVTGPASSEN